MYCRLDLHANLHPALCQLPSNKAFETYHAYENAMLPILEEAVAAMSARRLRREAPLSFMSKDKALDNICSKICGSMATPKNQKRGRLHRERHSCRRYGSPHNAENGHTEGKV